MIDRRQVRPRPHRILAWFLPALLGWGGSVLAATAPEDRDASVAESEVTEQVTVHAPRLAVAPVDPDTLAAHTTVIDRERIESSGARTVQELLSREAGVGVFDITGNAVEQTLDLRGFTAGTGTRVFLDGAPLNDPRNNAVDLDLVPLSGVERIVVTRGPAAAVAGGGAEGGVIHLHSRRGAERRGSVQLGIGSFDERTLAGDLGGSSGPASWFVTANRSETDGFRQNAGGERRRLLAGLHLDLDRQRLLQLTISETRSDLGNPGALTLAEFEADPFPAPFNRVDRADDRQRLVSLGFSAPLDENFTVAANLFAREDESRSLTTGRSGAESSLGLESSSLGATLQVSHGIRLDRGRNDLTFGAEWLDGESDAGGAVSFPGFGTSLSDNRSRARAVSVFAENVWQPAARWDLSAGVRYDRTRVSYDETLPLAGNADAKTYSEVSYRAGVTWHPAESHAIYGSYGEAYLAPTVEQLYAFPTFGSNPDLAPQDTRSVEAGWRYRRGAGLAVDVALFRIDTRDEIVFRFDPMTFVGLNENLGRTRRDGLEASVRGPVTKGLEAYANLTWLDAEFRNGANRGSTIPLAPDVRAAAGVNWRLPAGVTLNVEALHVDEQVLELDEPNEQPALDAYTTFDARLTWAVGVRDGGGAASRGRPEFFAEVRNVFDEAYATRGIYAFPSVFVTPAPGRTFASGVAWEF